MEAETVIDVEDYYKDAIDGMDESKTYGPLVIVDPVQPARNAAAAISDEKFEMFIDASKRFLKDRQRNFLSRRHLT